MRPLVDMVVNVVVMVSHSPQRASDYPVEQAAPCLEVAPRCVSHYPRRTCGQVAEAPPCIDVIHM